VESFLDNNIMDLNKQIETKIGLLILLVISVGAGLVILQISGSFTLPDFYSILTQKSKEKEQISEESGIKKFASEQEFKDYLKDSELGYYVGGLVGLGGIDTPVFEQTGLPLKQGEGIADGGIGGAGVEPDRVSGTNVQVLGIDEPDIVKTDGQQIYFSSGQSYYWNRWIEIWPPKILGSTKIIKAFPPAELKEQSKIDKRGDLLLDNNILIVFSGNKIYGYDVSNPSDAKEKWTIDLDSQSFLVSARLYDGKIYIVTRQNINSYSPCPIKPLSVNGDALTVKCADIYHPIARVPVDVNYSVVVFDPNSGKTEKTTSFVGTVSSSVVYVSENAIYITYYYQGNTIKFFTDFFKQEASDIVPSWVTDKMEALDGYDISDAAKFTEFSIILEKYYASLSQDEKLKAENELQNRLSDYYKERKRDLEKTGIVKIDIEDLSIAGSGNVPGKPLNQFSLDEYENNLRVAVTVGERFFGFRWGIGASTETANDVYILNSDLEIIGSVKDLGLDERIYSARFVQDKGYLVTFKQIDPFFVLDLSNPKAPEVKGELKIPGYSSYLHPISKDIILGVGKESSNVKLSLFDVSNPENPIETSKYNMNEYWSDILNTHHAFLLDTKHQIFFLPGAKGGYVFSYKDNQLELIKAVSDIIARRAVFINDYLYVIGDDKIVVLNEADWEKVNTLDL
jgi:uncharacterized secreted protein with C-terminal beta-propeller domain